jgi:hypothetical protein
MLSKSDVKKIMVEMVDHYGKVTLAKVIDVLPDKEGVFSDFYHPVILPGVPCTSISWNLSDLILDSILDLVSEKKICFEKCPAWYYLRDGWLIPRDMDIFGSDTTVNTDHFVWLPVVLIPWFD